MTYLIPPPPRPGDNTDRAHIAANGLPLCGASLPQPYAASGWLCAYNVCEDCERVRRGGQMRLVGEPGND